MKLLISYPVIGGESSGGNLIPVDVRRLGESVRDVSYLFLAVAFLFAALTLSLESFRIIQEGTAWNIIAKSFLYIVIISFSMDLYNMIAPLFAYLSNFFATLGDGRNAAEVLWRQLEIAPPSLPGLNDIGAILDMFTRFVGYPIIAMLSIVCLFTSFFVAVGRVIVMLGLVVFLPILLVLDLIPITKGFAQTLINSLVGLILSGPLVGILMNVSCYAFAPILSFVNYSDPIMKVMIGVGMITFISVTAGAFAYQFSSAMTAASTTAVSGSIGLLAAATVPTLGAAGGGITALRSLRSVGATKGELAKGVMFGTLAGLAAGETAAAEYGGKFVGFPIPSGATGRVTGGVQGRIGGMTSNAIVKNVQASAQNLMTADLAKAYATGGDKEYADIARKMFGGDPEQGFTYFKSNHQNLKPDVAKQYYDAMREYYMTHPGERAKLGYIASHGVIDSLVTGNLAVSSDFIRDPDRAKYLKYAPLGLLQGNKDAALEFYKGTDPADMKAACESLCTTQKCRELLHQSKLKGDDRRAQ
ncbi:MAG: hypothetical protein QXK18_07815 [Candidatus Bathyarchaeia archaeon]